MLDRNCLRGHAKLVAPRLLGAVIRSSRQALIITDVEAYGEKDDPASHAYRGVSKRNKTMFSDAGHLYVYLSYGIHNCINVVTDSEGIGGAVLIRGGIGVGNEGDGSPDKSWPRVISGPGRVGRHLEAQLSDDGVDLFSAGRWELRGNENAFCEKLTFERAQRIGISKAAELPWRYYFKNPWLALSGWNLELVH